MDIERTEHRLWRTLCDKLEEAGAIMDADRQAVIGSAGTPGCRLLNLIRQWADAHGQLLGTPSL